MRILILGADGYLGWPTSMYLASRGHRVCCVDSLQKRLWEAECGVQPLFPIPPFVERIRAWNSKTAGAYRMKGEVCDIADNPRLLDKVIADVKPEAIIHYAEQPSAPYSHRGAESAVRTQQNNVVGTLNLIFSVVRRVPDCHIIKLGTMGEYGTPNIDIEEGWLDVEHKGRKDRVLYPKKPGSWYHLSKVHDSHNLEFACRSLGLRVTDLNQGIVYGIETDETWLSQDLGTSFHYDAIFGTVINRFICQAASSSPITVYGTGSQIRGFLNIQDTMRCVELALESPPDAGEFRVFNQFTEQFSIEQLAERISSLFGGEVKHIKNPRVEQEDHYYNAVHTALPELGLEPTLLTDETLKAIHDRVLKHKDSIDPTVLEPTVKWRTK